MKFLQVLDLKDSKDLKDPKDLITSKAKRPYNLKLNNYGFTQYNVRYPCGNHHALLHCYGGE